MKNIKKNMRVLRELLYLRFHGLMVFRLDFFAPFFVDGSLFLVQILAFSAVYANVDTIEGWGKGEMILFIGTFSLLNAINMTVQFFGLNQIPWKVRSGELDLYLSKPGGLHGPSVLLASSGAWTYFPEPRRELHRGNQY